MISQIDLWNNECAPRDMRAEEQTRYVLEACPEARGDDGRLLVEHGLMFSNLDQLLADIAAAPDPVQAGIHLLSGWLTSTLKLDLPRRRREIQRIRDGGGVLSPSADIAHQRRQRDGSGPPWRR